MYLSNALATWKNLSKWRITQSSTCSFCLQSEMLQQIVSSCKSNLEQGRYTWRHESVLNFIANTLSGLQFCSLYADHPAFLSPSLITGNSLRPDFILITKDNNLYILQLTIGFESNIKDNSDRKAIKCNPFSRSYDQNINKLSSSTYLYGRLVRWDLLQNFLLIFLTVLSSINLYKDLFYRRS